MKLTLIALALLLSGCAGYQFGDATKAAIIISEIRVDHEKHKCRMKGEEEDCWTVYSGGGN